MDQELRFPLARITWRKGGDAMPLILKGGLLFMFMLLLTFACGIYVGLWWCG